MPRPRLSQGTKTSVEIEKFDVVKELCGATRESLKDYINRLIREDMMRKSEYFSNRYFKGAAPRV